MTYELDYDAMIFLDAEDLAENGIKDAYESLLPQLTRYVEEPAVLVEMFDANAPSYSVAIGDDEYPIYSPSLQDGEGRSWGRAAFALFSIVNSQLQDSQYRLYAINGGNDLGGVFLTESEAGAARNSLEMKTDWPYIPTDEHPWYGQFN